MFIIPFKETGSWQTQITLSDTIYNLYFKWNALNQYWVMNVFDNNNLPICYGIKVVVNWNLTGQFVVSGMPAGNIVCQNVLGQFNTITRFDMGKNDELFYYEPNELENLTA